jgi:hypothetical protein
MTTTDELGFRLIYGGKSGKLAVCKTPEVAEIFGIRHDDVLRDVREMQEQLSPDLKASFAEHWRPSTYRDADGTEQPCFELTRVGFNTVASKYDDLLCWLMACCTVAAIKVNDASTRNDAVRQVNDRIRELRSRAMRLREEGHD